MSQYLAWDGKTYQGQPPEGWVEAADGRWWPTEYVSQAPPPPPVQAPPPPMPAPPTPAPPPVAASADAGESFKLSGIKVNGKSTPGALHIAADRIVIVKGKLALARSGHEISYERRHLSNVRDGHGKVELTFSNGDKIELTAFPKKLAAVRAALRA